MPECCSLHFNRKILESFMKRSNYGLQKPPKIIKILDLFKNADISKIFVEFQCLDKMITQSMSPPPKKKHQSKLNINVRKQKK